MKAVSIIIVSFDGAALLKANLPSVIRACDFARVQYEIIVVDNGSQDGTKELIKSSFPTVRLISHPKNLGFIAATNQAVEKAKGKIIITLNNDMEVDKKYLTHLLAHFEEEDVFGVTPKVYFSDRRSLNAGLRYGHLKDGHFVEVLETDEKKLKNPQLTLYAHGGSAAFDREKFLELGGFDEIYAPFYQEALDLSYRAYKRGWQVIFEPRSVAYHQHRTTVNRLYTPEEIDRVLIRNQLLFYWSNITDIAALSEHFNYLAKKLWNALVEGDEAFIPAFFSALRRLKLVLARRAERKPFWVRSDRAVLEQING